MNKKIETYEWLLETLPKSSERYTDMLGVLGDLKNHYWEYLSTDPIDVERELERVPDADYDTCCAILTMLTREDHFQNGIFRYRVSDGSVEIILKRMIELLKEENWG